LTNAANLSVATIICYTSRFVWIPYHSHATKRGDGKGKRYACPFSIIPTLPHTHADIVLSIPSPLDT